MPQSVRKYAGHIRGGRDSIRKMKPLSKFLNVHETHFNSTFSSQNPGSPIVFFRLLMCLGTSPVKQFNGLKIGPIGTRVIASKMKWERLNGPPFCCQAGTEPKEPGRIIAIVGSDF